MRIDAHRNAQREYRFSFDWRPIMRIPLSVCYECLLRRNLRKRLAEIAAAIQNRTRGPWGMHAVSTLRRSSLIATFAGCGQVGFCGGLALVVRCDVVHMTVPGTRRGTANGAEKCRMFQLVLTSFAMAEHRRRCFHEIHTSRPTSTLSAGNGAFIGENCNRGSALGLPGSIEWKMVQSRCQQQIGEVRTASG
jgi:hypothetical protein